MKTVRQFINPNSGYAFRETLVDGKPFRIIDAPGVYLVGSMQLHANEVNEYLDDHGIEKFSPWGNDGHGVPNHINARNDRGTDHELAVELSGRICYMSYERPRPGGVGSFIDRIRAEGHGSVFEHPHYSFILSGVSRNLTLELNRHRPLNISQLSSRYVSAAEVGFVCDPDHNPEEFAEWVKACRNGMECYSSMFVSKYNRAFSKWKAKHFPDMSDAEAMKNVGPGLERKLVKRARDSARDALPGCLETRVYYTVNARAARFIFEKRCHVDAAFEIRRAMNAVYRKLKEHDPRLFDDMKETQLEDGTFTVETAFPKI